MGPKKSVQGNINASTLYLFFPEYTCQNVAFSTITFTFPGHLALFVKVGSIATSSNSSAEANSRSDNSVAEPCSSRCQGGEPDARNIPDAGAVSTSGEEIL